MHSSMSFPGFSLQGRTNLKLLPLHDTVKQKYLAPKLLPSFNVSYQSVVLYIIFLFIIVFIFRIVFAKDVVSFKKQISEKDLQTGDLVFVSYSNLLGYLSRGWTNSVWTHVGMILKDGNDIYVMETANYDKVWKDPGKQKTNGILTIPFKTWKKINSHHRVVTRRLETPSNFDRRKLILEFWKIKQKDLDRFGVGVEIFGPLFGPKTFKEEPENRNVTCSELMVKILQNANVMKKVYTPNSYFTKDLLEDLPLHPEFKFSKIITF